MFNKQTSIIVILVIVLIIMFFHAGYNDRIMIKLGLKENKIPTNWAVVSWNNCLEKLDYKADIVFFGDSITRGSDFRKYFPEYKICNLGYSGDSLQGMSERVSMIKAVKPSKVFIMGGINELKDYNVNESLKQYEYIIDKIQIECGDECRIYIQSVLPITKDKEKIYTSNETIQKFNIKLQELSSLHGCVYIDINCLYTKNGEMDKVYTKDGIHLYDEAYDIWAEKIRMYVYQ